MKTTQINLGKSELHIVKKKSKFKPLYTGYCNSPTCLCDVQLDENGKCLRCFNKVVRHFKNDATKKRFDNFIQNNIETLQHFICDEKRNYNLRIPIIINKSVYYVPLRYFMEYQNLTGTEEYIQNKDVAIESFFTMIKDVCYSTKF